MILPDDTEGAFAEAFAPDLRNPLADSRPVHWRWLMACGLIGLLGGALLVSALYASRSREYVARRPDLATPAQRGEASAPASRKADSLLQRSFAVSTAQHFRAPLTETAGGREITKVHALAHVSVALSPLPVANLDIPDLDATRLTSGAQRDALPDAIDLADADVSVTRRDLAAVTIPPESPSFTDAAVEAQVAEMMRLSAGAPQLPPDYSNQRILSRTLRLSGALTGAQDEAEETARFGSLDVRIIPENLTDIAPDNEGRARFDETDVVIAHGETLATTLKQHGASEERSAAILSALGGKAGLALPEGQHLRLTIGPAAGGRTIQRVTLFDETGPQRIVAEDDRGRFVTMAKPEAGRDLVAAKRPEDDGAGVTLYQSAYAGALKSEVPRDVIEDTIRAFAAGTDLRQQAGAGDRLELVFTEDEAGAGGHHELLFAGLTAAGDTQQLYRRSAPEAGERDYLDKDGVALSKLLLRKPVQTGRISSPFGMRYHPILHYSRLHNGVDWASPRGTPIMAAGDGTVAAAGPHSGYGNRVEIEHANGYASAYNHMASIARQITPGAHVHMGEIIGYVGTTGLSTGPHVHYEVTTNGHFVDPMKVKLPSSRILTGTALAEFQERRRQIDELRRHGGAIASGSHPT